MKSLFTVILSFLSLAVHANGTCQKLYGSYELEVIRYNNDLPTLKKKVFIGQIESVESKTKYAIYDEISVESQNIFETLTLTATNSSCIGMLDDGWDAFVIPARSMRVYREVSDGNLYEVFSFHKKAFNNSEQFDLYRIKKILDL